MSNLDWMGSAACIDEEPELFFPSSVGVAGQRQAQRAARVCAGCPVQRECGEHRGTTGATAGVWGGSYHKTRPPKKLPPINHGTNGGYQVHMDRRETPCERCRFAHMVANRKWARR